MMGLFKALNLDQQEEFSDLTLSIENYSNSIKGNGICQMEKCHKKRSKLSFFCLSHMSQFIGQQNKKEKGNIVDLVHIERQKDAEVEQRVALALTEIYGSGADGMSVGNYDVDHEDDKFRPKCMFIDSEAACGNDDSDDDDDDSDDDGDDGNDVSVLDGQIGDIDDLSKYSLQSFFCELDLPMNVEYEKIIGE